MLNFWKLRNFFLEVKEVKEDKGDKDDSICPSNPFAVKYFES
jgi:hypothetical protein